MTFRIEALEWLAQAIGSTPSRLHYQQLKGSTSSSVYLIQDTRDDKPQRFVLRVPENQEWLADEPDLIVHEAAVLVETQRAGLCAPELIAFAAHDVGFGAPVLLMSFMEGHIDLRPRDFPAWIDNLAQELAVIHRHTAPSFGWHYRSWVDKTALAVPVWTTIPHVWERAIHLVDAPPPPFQPVFIHRDYHPMNVLWHDGMVSGVVDWINACQGPAGVDVAHCRTNLMGMFGSAAADQFLAAYSKMADGFVYHPYWDLDSLLDMCIPEPTVYPPWLEFGLAHLTPTLLQQRADAYLQQIINGTDSYP